MAQSTVNPVLLPTDAARTLDSGPAGWTSSAQVTATGCGSGSCPVAAGAWNGASSSGGVLGATLSGSAGHSGVATVTWRSPLFVVPAASGAATFSLSADTSYTWAPASGVVPTYSVHLIDSGTGTLRSIVDSNPLPTPSQGWSTSGAITVPAGALTPGSVQRLEVVVSFPISARAGDSTVSFDDPTLTLDQLADVALPPIATTPPSTPGTTPPIATPASGPLDASTPAGDDDLSARDSTPAPGCQTDDVDVIGAAASGRTLRISGTAAEATGAPVDLLSVDGWLLGHTLVDGQGRFSAQVAEPNGSAGTRTVFARLADGRRSPAVAVQRRNVLRDVRATSRGFAIRGTVDAKLARTGHFGVDLELPGAAACRPTETVHASGVRIDRRTGAYRALVSTAAFAASASRVIEGASTEPVLVRSRVTQSGVGRARVVTRSQVIFGPKSDRRGT